MPSNASDKNGSYHRHDYHVPNKKKVATEWEALAARHEALERNRLTISCPPAILKRHAGSEGQHSNTCYTCATATGQPVACQMVQCMQQPCHQKKHTSWVHAFLRPHHSCCPILHPPTRCACCATHHSGHHNAHGMQTWATHASLPHN